ncbi:L,D-transpeptidase [bacterium]|nr:L,D-transpeptidase [bacterium]
MINPVKLGRIGITAIAFTTALMSARPVFSRINQSPDTYENTVTPKGITNTSELKNAPSPYLLIKGKKQTARIVVDLSKNILYKYNEFGVAENAYKVASGKKSTPTHKGVRIVSHIETYPYKTAYGTKRKRNPRAYGPKILILKKLNPKTGEETPTGEFIHGNNNSNSIGKYVSNGCIRMDNEVIKEFAKEFKPGDIVIIQ